MRISVVDLDPREAERGRNSQAQQLYLQRVSALQTGVPPEILIDWFQEQPSVAPLWTFLDLKNISWNIEIIELSAIPGAEAFKGGSGQMERLTKDVHWERQWIYKNLEKNGTWLTPPILLRTENMRFLTSPSIQIQKPLHLAEGYHRMAALHALKKKNATLNEHHKFWVGSPKTPGVEA